MDLRTDLERTQRLVLWWMPVLASSAFVWVANDAAMIGKFAAAIGGAALLVALTLWRIARHGRLSVPRHPMIVAVTVFAAIAWIAALASPTPMLSIFGAYTRYAGALGYTIFAILVIGVIATHRLRNLPMLAGTVIGAAALVGVYGLLQLLGSDPITWDNPEFDGLVLGTFGNPNFAAAFLAIGLPLAVWGALHEPWDPAWRIGSAITAVLCVIGMVGTDAVQGYFAGAVGLLIFGVAWLSTRPERVRRPGLIAVAVVSGIGALVAVSDLAGFGPIKLITSQSTYRTRTFLWRSGMRMFGDAPLLGKGVDRFGDHYNEFRPLEETLRRPLERASDSAHDVIINLAAGGGAPLAIAFLVIAGLALWCIVLGMREGDAHERLLVGGFGGAWAAYQVQALISIDVTALVVLHAIVLGGLVVAGWPPERREVVFGALGGGAGRAVTMGVAAVIGVLGVGGALALTAADVWLAEGQRAAANGNLAIAEESFERASGVNRWEDTYTLQHAIALIETGSTPLVERGVALLDETLRRNADELSASVTAGRASVQLGDLDEALRYYALARDTEPVHPEFAVEYARVALSAGEEALATELLDDAVAVARRAIDELDDPARAVTALREVVDAAPGSAPYQVAYGEALLLAGDVDGARDAAEAATAIDPETPGLSELLAAIGS